MNKSTIQLLGLVFVVMLALVACTGESPTATPLPTDTPVPTDTPEPAPTVTPVPTVDPADMPVADLQATVVAIEENLSNAENRLAGASSASEQSAAEYDINRYERELAAVQILIEQAGDGGAAVSLLGDFEDVREWTWTELESLMMIEASVTSPDEDGQEVEYNGVSLNALLDAAGLGGDAVTLIATAADGTTVEIDIASVRGDTGLLVLDEGKLDLIIPDLDRSLWVTNLTTLEAQ